MFELLVEYLQGIEKPLDEEGGLEDSDNFVKAKYRLGHTFDERANKLGYPMELTGLRQKSIEFYKEIPSGGDSWYFASGRWNMAIAIDKIMNNTDNPDEREKLWKQVVDTYLEITPESDPLTYAKAQYNLGHLYSDRAENISKTPEDRINHLLQASEYLGNVKLDMDREQYSKSQHNNACYHHFICEIEGGISDETADIIAKSFIEADTHTNFEDSNNPLDLIMDMMLFEMIDELPEGIASVQELQEIITTRREEMNTFFALEQESNHRDILDKMDESLNRSIKHGEKLRMQSFIEKCNTLKEWIKTHLI